MPSVIPGTPTLGSRKLYEILFNEVFGARAVVSERDVRAYCRARTYRVGSELDGALALLVNIRTLTADGGLVGPGPRFEEIACGGDLGLSLSALVIEELTNTDEITEIFQAGSVSLGERVSDVRVHKSKIPFRYLPVIRLLRELGALSEADKRDFLLNVIPPISDLLVASLFTASRTQRSTRVMTPEAFLELQRIKAIQGEAAEEFVLAYERLRLTGHPHPTLIRRISLENVAAGFDIISFDSPKSVVPDRFIEVKSFRTNEQFFLSSGEAAAAAELKERYFIYVVDAEASKAAGYQPKIVQNPMKTIFDSPTNWRVVPATWEISRPPRTEDLQR